MRSRTRTTGAVALLACLLALMLPATAHARDLATVPQHIVHKHAPRAQLLATVPVLLDTHRTPVSPGSPDALPGAVRITDRLLASASIAAGQRRETTGAAAATPARGPPGDGN